MDNIRKKLQDNDKKEDCITDSSQSVSALAINNSSIVKIDNFNLSIGEISPNGRSSISLPTIQEILRKNVIEKGEFFRKDVCWADFSQDFILERNEVNKIISNLERIPINLPRVIL